MELTDEELVIACRRNEAAAWDLLVDRYRMLIFTIGRRAGLDEEQAADLLQLVFTILLERIDTIEQPALIGAWLISTTKREAWRLRRLERLAGVSSSSEGELRELVDGSAPPDELVQRLETQRRLYLALEALDGRCRELLTMLYLRPDTPSYAEIAAAMGMREGAVGPTRARCLQKLRRLMADEQP
jgi:RNA polymerase sigma factor (sigma-70 family)